MAYPDFPDFEGLLAIGIIQAFLVLGLDGSLADLVFKLRRLD
jgi:hypothetical protein